MYDSLLNLKYNDNSKIMAFADDLMLIVKGNSLLEIENHANIELQKISSWAEQNKIIFNSEKSKLMVVTRRKTKPDREINIFLNKILQQSDNMKYLGILIDKRFSFNIDLM